MHISGSRAWRVDNSKTVTMKCPVCNNTGEHYMVGLVVGPNLGFIWMPNKYHLGYRKYWLSCPVCNKITKELTAAEAQALRSIY